MRDCFLSSVKRIKLPRYHIRDVTGRNFNIGNSCVLNAEKTVDNVHSDLYVFIVLARNEVRINENANRGERKGSLKTAKTAQKYAKKIARNPHRIFSRIPKPHENANQSNENTRLYGCTSEHPAWNWPKQF